MAKMTQLVRDDAYEDMGATYQCIQVAMLDAALQEHGVSEPSIRQEICESFLFAIGNFHDQGWMKTTSDSEKVYPLLCFATCFPNADTAPNELGEVLAPSTMFAFHEYASGNAALLYEGDENAHVEIGIYDGEV